MRKFAFLGGLAALLALPPAASAQEVQQPGTIVFSQNKCHMARVAELTDYTRTTVAPILDELVAEGRLMGWGVLTHLWGDEWNWNIYYTAADIPTFLGAFDEFFSRVQTRDPDFMRRFGEFCFEHKDSLYGVAMIGAMPGS